MSKYSDVSENLQDTFFNVLGSTSIPLWVRFKLLCDNNQSDVYQVKKMSELYNSLTGYDIVIIFNEDVINNLDDEIVNLIIEEALTGVVINFENDKISLNKFDFTTYSSMLSKHGEQVLINMKIKILEIYKSLKNAEQ